jgi:hypothetical protein
MPWVHGELHEEGICMAKKVKFKVATRLVGLYEVVNYEDHNEPPAEVADVNKVTEVVSRIYFAQTGSDGCWWVREEYVKSPGIRWWGWPSSPCMADPVFRVRLEADGHIEQIAYKKSKQNWIPLLDSSPPAGAVTRITVEICLGDDKIVAGVCRYIVSGGRAYRVC